ncbi:hypothetical protein ACFOND_01030 [Reinekea marina]|uniref:Uncharacterized protein n=1 Tax=Reinekea marina TaxID=1310421 RepID=A0ABV7WNV0_9GAMM
MASDRKSILLEKRNKLKHQQEKSERLALIEDLLSRINDSGIDYAINFDSPAWQWLEITVDIHSWVQINQNPIENKLILTSEEHVSMSEAYFKLCSYLEPLDETVSVIWSNALRPELELGLNAIPLILDDIINQDFDFWIVPSSRKWCIEYHHTGTFAAFRFD